MRAFAGIPVPAPARDELGRLLADLRQRGWPVKWVRPDTLHLTLHFFGEIPDDVAAALGASLDRAAKGQGPLVLAGAELGAFPDPHRARVIWFGLEPSGELELLAHRAECEFAAQGFERDARPFHPHITLGRVQRDARLPAGAWEMLPAAPEVAFSAAELVLFESRTGPAGPAYTPRHTTRLVA